MAQILPNEIELAQYHPGGPAAMTIWREPGTEIDRDLLLAAFGFYSPITLSNQFTFSYTTVAESAAACQSYGEQFNQ